MGIFPTCVLFSVLLSLFCAIRPSLTWVTDLASDPSSLPPMLPSSTLSTLEPAGCFYSKQIYYGLFFYKGFQRKRFIKAENLLWLPIAPFMFLSSSAFIMLRIFLFSVLQPLPCPSLQWYPGIVMWKPICTCSLLRTSCCWKASLCLHFVLMTGCPHAPPPGSVPVPHVQAFLTVFFLKFLYKSFSLFVFS